MAGMIGVPYYMEFYSPFSSIYDDFLAPAPSPNEYEENAPPINNKYNVIGRIVNENLTPLEYTEVRIFATDELVFEITESDSEGYFHSTLGFLDGQILTITVLDQRFTFFIEYTVEREDLFPETNLVDMGIFVVD